MRFLMARTPARSRLFTSCDHVKDAELMLDVIPVALQSIFIERRAIGNDHLGGESAIFEGL